MTFARLTICYQYSREQSSKNLKYLKIELDVHNTYLNIYARSGRYYTFF